MKYERCPNCNGKLAIPDKKRGLPVECPVCELEFVPADAVVAESDSSKSTSSEIEDSVETQSSRQKKPSLRSIPVSSSAAAPRKEPKSSSQFKTTEPDPMLPPGKSRLNTLAPGSKKKAPNLSGPPSPPLKRPSPPESIASTTTTAAIDEPGEPPSDLATAEIKIAPTHDATVHSETERQPGSTVAKIITSEPVQTLLTKEGKLPTLQLKDEVKPKKPETKLTSNPMFVGLLICVSLVSSCLMFLMFSATPSNSKNRIAEARESIRQFYEVDIDEELKPYQIELREAQLAHSRGDHKAEIKAYQRVMARFRAEDRSQYTGLTGSPSWDTELQDLVSILLNEAKRESRSFLD